LDELKITTGIFDLVRIPTLDVARIPALAASKITTGIFDITRIPALDATKITTGAFNSDRIPALDTSKTTTGIFDITRIPDLDASKITTGTFDASFVPALAEKAPADDAQMTGHVFLPKGININFRENPRFTSNMFAVASDYETLYGWETADFKAYALSNRSRAFRAFNKANNSFWDGGIPLNNEVQWLQLTYPYPVVVKGYHITTSADLLETCFPNEFRLQGSNYTGSHETVSEWEEIDIQRHEPVWAVSTTKKYLDNINPLDKAYKHYRLMIKGTTRNANDSTTQVIVKIAQLVLFSGNSLQFNLDLKAPKASPTMTGVVNMPHPENVYFDGTPLSFYVGGGVSNGNSTVPSGTIISYAGQTIPFGYLECDGQEVSRTTCLT
jgi:hypothetical protein